MNNDLRAPLPETGEKKNILVVSENSDFELRIQSALGRDPAVDLVCVGGVDDGIEFIEHCRSRGSSTLDLVILWCGTEIATRIQSVRRARVAALGVCPLVVVAANIPDNLILPLLAIGVEGVIAEGGSDRALELTLLCVEEGLAVSPGELQRRATRLILDLRQGRDKSGELSPRERDVATQIILGKSNRTIAETLNISEGTVKSHLRSIFKKTNTSNRTQAALHALRQIRTQRR